MIDWRFVARERELYQLDMALQRALTGRGNIVFLTGEAGVGKTALATEFIKHAQAANPTLLVAPSSCKNQNVPEPYLPFREVLGLLTGDVEDSLAQGTITAEMAQQLQAILPTSAQILTDVGSALIDTFVSKDDLSLRGQELGDNSQIWLNNLQNETPVPGQPDLTQAIIFEQYVTVLQALADQYPIIIWIDNLQWADASSMSLLFHLGESIIDQNAILIIGCYRPEQVTLQQEFTYSIDRVVEEFESYIGEIEICLDSTSEIDSLEFIDALLDLMPNRLDEGFRRDLFRYTAGQPLFMIELIENMQARGELVTDENGYWVTGPTLNWEILPQKVEDLLEERISQLDSSTQVLLSAASVEGLEFTLEVLAQVCSLSQEMVTEKLNSEFAQDIRLVNFRGYQRQGAQNLTLYQFRHNFTQKYLYSNLSEKERVLYHREVGQALANLYGDQGHKIAAQLAWHFQQAGITEKAVEYFQLVADRAAHVYAYKEAITYYKQAIEMAVQLGADQKVLLHLYSQLGRILELNSQFNQALDIYQDLERLAQERGDRQLELAALNARVVIQAMPTPLYDAHQGEILARRALLLSRELGVRSAESQVLWNLCKLYYMEGDYQDSITYGEKGLSLARELELPEQVALFLNDLSRPYGLLGQTSHALTKLQEATDLWRKLNNLPMLADSLNSASAQHVRRGEFDQALKKAAEAAQIGESTNNLWTQSFSQMEIGNIYWTWGQIDQAVAIMKKSIDLGERGGFLVTQTKTRSDLAALYGSLGAMELSLATARKAVDISEESNSILLRSYALGSLARLQLLQGDREAAQAAVNQVGDEQAWEAISLFNVPLQLASIELDFGQESERVLEKINRLLQWLKKAEMRLWLPEAMFLQSKVLTALGQEEKALDSLVAARIEAESLQSRRLLWPILLALSQHETDSVAAGPLRQQAREIVRYLADHIHIHDLNAAFLSRPSVHDLLPEKTDHPQ